MRIQPRSVKQNGRLINTEYWDVVVEKRRGGGDGGGGGPGEGDGTNAALQ